MAKRGTKVTPGEEAPKRQMATIRNEAGRVCDIPEDELWSFLRTYPDTEVLKGTPRNPVKMMVNKFDVGELMQAVSAAGLRMPKNPTPAKLAGMLMDEGGLNFIESVLSERAKIKEESARLFEESMDEDEATGDEAA